MNLNKNGLITLYVYVVTSILMLDTYGLNFYTLSTCD